MTEVHRNYQCQLNFGLRANSNICPFKVKLKNISSNIICLIVNCVITSLDLATYLNQHISSSNITYSIVTSVEITDIQLNIYICISVIENPSECYRNSKPLLGIVKMNESLEEFASSPVSKGTPCTSPQIAKTPPAITTTFNLWQHFDANIRSDSKLVTRGEVKKLNQNKNDLQTDVVHQAESYRQLLIPLVTSAHVSCKTADVKKVEKEDDGKRILPLDVQQILDAGLVTVTRTEQVFFVSRTAQITVSKNKFIRESQRLLTYSNFKSSCMSAHSLALEGFIHVPDLAKDAVACAWCHLKLCNFLEPVNVKALHRAYSEDVCQFIQLRKLENVSDISDSCVVTPFQHGKLYV